MTQQRRAIDLREEFPRWQLSKSGINRSWAMRIDRPTTAQIKAGCKLYLDGDTEAELRDRLHDEEARLAKVAG